MVSRKFVITCGTPIRIAAYARVMNGRRDKQGNRTYLRWGTDIFDRAGHHINLQTSQIDFNQSITLLDGSTFDTEGMDPPTRARVGDGLSSTQIHVRYRLEKSVKKTLKPVPFVTYTMGPFTTELPPHWRWRANVYMTQANRAFDQVKAVNVGRPPKKITIQWRGKGSARGSIGKPRRARIFMPFGLVREPRAWFSRPRSIIHELLHNCGFGHSDTLRTAQSAAVVKYEEYPWRIAIKPNLSMPVVNVNGRINAQSAL